MNQAFCWFSIKTHSKNAISTKIFYFSFSFMRVEINFRCRIVFPYWKYTTCFSYFPLPTDCEDFLNFLFYFHFFFCKVNLWKCIISTRHRQNKLLIHRRRLYMRMVLKNIRFVYTVFRWKRNFWIIGKFLLFQHFVCHSIIHINSYKFQIQQICYKKLFYYDKSKISL